MLLKYLFNKNLNSFKSLELEILETKGFLANFTEN